MISNLYYPATIDDCYSHMGEGSVPGIKDENNRWNIRGHQQRIIHVDKNTLSLFSKLYDSNGKWKQARIPALHAKDMLKVLTLFTEQKYLLKDKKDIYTTQMFDETGAQDSGVIIANDINIFYLLSKYSLVK